MKLNWNFQRGGEVLGKNPLCGRGMHIFWNYTMLQVSENSCYSLFIRHLKIPRISYMGMASAILKSLCDHVIVSFP